MKPWIILDAVVVAVFVISAVVGLKKGLMKMFFGIASFAVSGIAVFMLVSPFTAYVMHTELPDKVREHIQPPIESVFETSKGNVTPDEALERSGIPDFAVDFIQKNTDLEKVKDSFVETVTESAVSGIVKIFCMIIIFVGIHIVLSVIIWIIGDIMKNTVLGSFNRMLGAVIGVANAMIIVYLLCAMVVLLSPVAELGAVTDLIQKSFITKSFYNNNVLMNIFCR